MARSIVLIKDKKYAGKHVTFKDFKDRKVITSGRNPIAVVNKAKKLGYANPVILYVPKHDGLHIFAATA